MREAFSNSFNHRLASSNLLPSPTRYRAIVNPMDIQTSRAVGWTCVKAVGIWVISVLLAVPEAVFSEVTSIDSLENATFTACIPYPQTDELHPKIHSVLIFLVYFLIPLAIISVYYYHIAKTLIKSAHNLPGEYNEHAKKQDARMGLWEQRAENKDGSIFILTNGTVSLYLQMETRKRLAKIVLVFVGCFVFCWFPNHILYMYRSFNYNEIDPSLGHMIVTLVARVLSFCNSCVNPFALYLLSESFRRHFNSQLCCGRKSYQERSTSYFPSSSAVRMTSLKSNAKNMMTNSVLLNGHSMKQEMAL
ncbi:hypothetical protein GH733_000780 [Mirounga leonina]|nr:hypothetical protein GH733_000780 [Mirounga leonina]